MSKTLLLKRLRAVAFGVSLMTLAAWLAPLKSQTAGLANPILFVTQVPIPTDFTTVASVFGNHVPSMENAGRGGDLWIAYPDGTVKNLTQAAGFGNAGQQGAQSIAVREPSVHWSGSKALFSMVVGAPVQFEVKTFYWQVYEITGLGQNQQPAIRKIAGQPENFNNVSPFYGTDERILFTSDRPRNGAAHLYPQLDEYELAPTNTGIWSLDPATGDLFLLDHAPSGVFTPSIDSFGRVVFTRWDHLQRDQEADIDALNGSNTYGTFNFSSEAANAARLNTNQEIFPEPRSARKDLLAGTNLVGHRMNQFFPWQIHEDGTEAETLNHVGRHELLSYFDRSLTDDGNLTEFIAQRLDATNLLQLKEDPTQPGSFFGNVAPEFGTHGGGQIVKLNAAPSVNAEQMRVVPVTAAPASAGHYRNPLPLANGALAAIHAAETRDDANEGSLAQPRSRYDFRLKLLTRQSDGSFVPGTNLTQGINKAVSYWNPDTLISYSGNLWELDPVEVRARPKPARLQSTLAAEDQQIFTSLGIDPAALRAYLASRDLGMIVTHNVTTRDSADKQQPFNLRVAGTNTQTVGASGKIYDVQFLQLLQGDQIRGFRGPGRRVLAQLMHDAMPLNGTANGVPQSSVKIGTDGSVAAFVPARRALSWQLLDPAGTPVVRERYWLTVQPGEIRVCGSCHGLNTRDQAGRAQPQNAPAALRDLLVNSSVAKELGTTPSPGLPFTGSMPHLASAGDWTTMFTLVNMGAGSESLRLNLLNESGNAISLPMAEAPSTAGTSSALFTASLAANASTLVTSSGPLAQPVNVGSAQLFSSSGVNGFAVFRYNSRHQEAVVPLETRDAGSYVLPFDHIGGVSLGVALGNVANSAGNVAATLRDDAGTVIGSGSVALPALGHVSFVLAQQFPITANRRGTVEFATPPNGRISALGVRFTPPGTLTTIPVLANVNNSGGSFAHLAAGSGWKTSLVLVNTSDTPAQATVRYFNDGGSALILPLNFPQTSTSTNASSIDRTIAPRASLILETGGLSAALNTGSIEFTTTGNVGGVAVFRYEPNGQEAAVPLENRGFAAYLVAFDNSVSDNGAMLATGVAISNPSGTSMTVPVIMRDANGLQIGVSSFTLPAHGHTSFVLASQFPATAGKRGTVEFAANVSVIGIRTQLPVLTFTSLPPLAR